MRNFFLLADGAPLKPAKIRRLRSRRFTVAIDGAAKQARREKWLPNRISGDFDTVTPATLEYFRRRRVEISPTPDQNYTDLEKALARCVEEKAQSIWVAQGLGKRLDHSLANLSFLKRFHSAGRELFLFTEGERVRYAEDQTLTLRGKKGRRIAVIPFPACMATSRFLAYELVGHKLELGFSESVSNHALRAQITLKIKGAALVIEEFL